MILSVISASDATATTITVSAGGVDRTIRAYALAELRDRPEGMPGQEFRARARLQELVTRLGTLETWLPNGSLGPETGYEASAARLFIGAYRKVDDLPQEPAAWPLEGDLASFGDADDDSGLYRCGVVEGADWAAVREAASRANELTPWTDGGTRSAILFRPLLPDETGC